MQRSHGERIYTSESTFVLPPELPGTDKRVRIFTPMYEMPMAGHPTVGTTFVPITGIRIGGQSVIVGEGRIFWE